MNGIDDARAPDEQIEIPWDGRPRRVLVQRIVDQGALVLKRQNVPADREEIERLVRLLPRLYTLPSYEHLERRAREVGLELTSHEITKVAWLLRACMQVMNSE